jgi:thiamine-phosphate diphosphorylase
MPLPRLHLVTDSRVLDGPGFSDVAEHVMTVCGPACALHLRGHGTSGRQLHELGLRLAASALRSGAWLLVNDRVDIAMAVRANGVQLGLSSLPVPDARLLLGAGAVIGYSAHGALEAAEAAADGADFVLAGTIWESASHAGRRPAGPAMLRECVERAPIPVLAVGGVTPARVTEAVAAGAHGVAVLRGVWAATDPTAAAVEYGTALRDAFSDPAMGAAVQRDIRVEQQ